VQQREKEATAEKERSRREAVSGGWACHVGMLFFTLFFSVHV
jgi:hypothetical protein